jgi:hypothetical protein
MPLPYPADPSLIPIERPHCPKCLARMMLAHIEHGPAGSDLRTFECPKCEQVQKRLAEAPIESEKAELNSERRLPE